MRRRRYPVLIACILVLYVAPTLLFLSNPGGRASNSLLTSLSAAARVPPALDNQGHLYVLDGWGGLHPVGMSPILSTSASWPTKDIAYGLALFPDGSGGYVR